MAESWLAASVNGMRLLARVVVQHLQRGVAEAPFGDVDDALEGEIVGRLRDHTQIGEGITNFGAFIEAGPPITR